MVGRVDSNGKGPAVEGFVLSQLVHVKKAIDSAELEFVGHGALQAGRYVRVCDRKGLVDTFCTLNLGVSH